MRRARTYWRPTTPAEVASRFPLKPTAVIACAYDDEKGTLKQLQVTSTLPKDANRKNASTAETVVHPSGKFVYVSNRGHNSIAIFSVDQKTGMLKAAGHESRNIATPR